MPEVHDIFVRAHTVISEKKGTERPSPAKWPEDVLVFDTETTVDTIQKLNFGAYRRCKLSPAGYKCVEEGLFYADGLDMAQRQVLERFVDDPRNFPQLDVKMFPPTMRLNLYSRSDFVERVFWRAIRKGAMVVGFNLPFDLSRLAVRSRAANNGGWSLVLSLRKSRKTGEMEPNPERPRVVIISQNSKMAFIGLRSIRHPEEWRHEGRFLDLRVLRGAIRPRSPSAGSRGQSSLGNEFETDVLRVQFRLTPRDTGTEPVWFAYSLAYAVVAGAADVLEVPSADLSATVAYGSAEEIPAVILYDNVPGGAGLVARLEELGQLRNCLEKAMKRVSGICGCDENTSCLAVCEAIGTSLPTRGSSAARHTTI